MVVCFGVNDAAFSVCFGVSGGLGFETVSCDLGLNEWRTRRTRWSFCFDLFFNIFFLYDGCFKYFVYLVDFYGRLIF